MSITELKMVYDGKELPVIDDEILAHANMLAQEHNCSEDEALMYILDMMIEKPFGE